MTFERARKIADAVLYEGYVLYPYRASARKNRIRWQFGVLAPREWSEAGGAEPWSMQTECLVESASGGEPRLTGKARFLQVVRRRVEQKPAEGDFRPVETLEVGGRLWTTWEEGIEREIDLPETRIDELARSPREVRFDFPSEREVEPIEGGRVIREKNAISGIVRWSAERLEPPLHRVRVSIENCTPGIEPATPRDEAVRSAFVGTHTLLSVSDGAFVSLLDPPEWAKSAVASCSNERTWPVLAGEEGDRGIVLSSPIILYDHPQIAPESPGELFDSTEIDEILTLRTMTLTDEEKREARATDPRAAAIIDRVDDMPPEVLDRLHGAIRYVRDATAGSAAPSVEPPPVPWWDPGADASVSPETDSIEVGGVSLSRGSRVRLRPGTRRADAQDMFLEGRTARVEAVFSDVEERNYLAVTLEDDPSSELFQWHGRYLYFSPDEVEPLEKAR